MKIIPIACLMIVPFLAFAAEVKPGDSFASVKSTLGSPRGQLKLGERDLFYYDRGEVELRSGVVTRVMLRSEADQAALDARRSADAQRVREEQEIRRARLMVEGDALKARKLSDPAFLAAPLSYQVAFWEDFSRRYSDVPSAEQLQTARARFAVEVADQRRQTEQTRRLAELEARVAEAEALASASIRQGFYPFYGRYRGYHSNPHPFSMGPIKYQFFESPLPYATSPGMPPMQPTYRKDSAPLDYSAGRTRLPSRLDRNQSDLRRSYRDRDRY